MSAKREDILIPVEVCGVTNNEDNATGNEDNAGESVHVPVLPTETLDALLAGRDEQSLEGWFVDGTTGAGGHSELLLDRCPKINLLCIDQDPDALRIASERLARFGERVRLRRARHSELCRVIRKERIGRLTGVLFDLGVCSLHLDRPKRGFSFAEDGPLDMRMDPERERTAADIVNGWDESDLADLIYYEGDERQSRKIAAAIIEARRRSPFMRTSALAELIARTIGGGGGKIHPATRTFQALRRAVNEEGDELMQALQTAEHWLEDGGVLAVIAFHSGEDRVVKRYFRDGAKANRWHLQSKKPLVASREETSRNRRSRSAKLRAAARTRTQRGSQL